jgi:predicted RNase H-like nuclease (RuvC/YqgF family)
MGRTNPTYRDALSAIEERWSSYRRALRRRDRERFDRLFGYAREHADAAGARNHRNPLVAALVGMAIEQERRHDDAAGDRECLAEELAAVADRLERIDARLRRIDGRFERLEGRVDELAQLHERVDALEATVDAAALDETLDDAGYRPAVSALANRLEDASLPDGHGFEDDVDGTDDVECDDAIDGDDATEDGTGRGDGSRPEGGA